MGMDTIGVRVAGISKRYTHRVKGEIYAAREVELDVKPGEFLTLLGPSGCGKTTTLRVIAGFEHPDAGRVYFGDEDVTGKAANQRNIGFVFQNYALFPHLSIFENVAYGLRVRGQAGGEIAKAVGDVLALVGLAGYEQQFSAPLSRAASSSGSRSPAPSSSARGCCCSTSRCRTSTPSCASRCARRSARCSAGLPSPRST